MQALSLEQLQGASTDGTDGLRGVLADLMGIPCDFRTQSQPFRVGTGDKIGARAWVDMLGSASVGDEIVQVAVAPTSELPVGGVQEVVYGIRERRIQITALSTNQELHRSARAYLEQLENKLALTATADTFAELGLAVFDWSDISVLDPTAFGRVSSVASIDLRVRHGTKAAAATIPRMATARVRGTVDGRSALDTTEP